MSSSNISLFDVPDQQTVAAKSTDDGDAAAAEEGLAEDSGSASIAHEIGRDVRPWPNLVDDLLPVQPYQGCRDQRASGIRDDPTRLIGACLSR